MKKRTFESVLDEYLVTASQGGDRRAMRMLIRRWNQRFTSFAGRSVGDFDTARDVVQEAWIAIMRGLSRLEDPARFRAWAYRIVSNKARDFVRTEQRRRRAMAVFSAVPEEAGGTDHTDLQLVRNALAHVTEQQRALLSLFYADGLSVREIGEVLEVPAGTVKSRLFHARKALKATLEEEPK